MNYKDEDEEDKRYKKGNGKNGKYSKNDFKKDITEAVADVPKAPKAKKARMSKNGYSSMGVGALRKLLNDKKKALLIKSGFPDGKIPRSKEQMISLCKKLKRKKW